jgi:hypothetical protein
MTNIFTSKQNSPTDMQKNTGKVITDTFPSTHLIKIRSIYKSQNVISIPPISVISGIGNPLSIS